jgi:hypothetical protein
MTYMPQEGGRVTLWYVPGERGVLAMTGPTGPAAAGGDRIRASHAERDQVVETLKNAFVDGQLTKDEFDERAGQALTARTRSELAALTDDVLASPDAAPPASTAHPAPPAPPAAAGPGTPPAGHGGGRDGRLPGRRVRPGYVRR